MIKIGQFKIVGIIGAALNAGLLCLPADRSIFEESWSKEKKKLDRGILWLK
jgi:hypothetical protein